MLVSIIIPFLDHWELVHARLDEIRKFAPDNCEIILVDDCSVGDYDDQVGWWQNYGAKHKVWYVKNKKNLGFGGAMNMGAKHSHGDILVFLSNDVVIHNDFITPICVACDYWEYKCLVGAELLEQDTGWNTFNGKTISYLNGWLVACPKDVWDDIGGFDERFGLHDYEDIDLSFAAIHKGYKLVRISGATFDHLGAQTANYGDERMAITLSNKAKFEEKWKDELK